jgi:DNA-binding transcriptional regulator YdaS (Cro superfamily)
MKMTIKEFRRAYLEEAVKICGTAELLGERCGISPPYISLLRTGRREVGHKSARSIEKGVGWPEGSMDRPPLGEDGSVEITHLLKTLPEETAIAAVIASLPQLSAVGVRQLTAALLKQLHDVGDS